LPRLVATGRLFGYNTPEYLKDMGTPERFAEVNEDWARGKVERLHRRFHRPAIFLGLDGVLCRGAGDHDPNTAVDLHPLAASAVRRINRSEHLEVLVTGRLAGAGSVDPSGMEGIRRTVETLLGAQRAKLDLMISCSDGERVRRFAEANHIDLARSYLIGASRRDLELARGSGIATVAPRAEHGRNDVLPTPDLLFDDLVEAVGFLLDGTRGHGNRDPAHPPRHGQGNAPCGTPR
jgi:histidinol phosphatase-like enzyme